MCCARRPNKPVLSVGERRHFFPVGLYSKVELIEEVKIHLLGNTARKYGVVLPSWLGSVVVYSPTRVCFLAESAIR